VNYATIVLVIQVGTFVALGVSFLVAGQTRLGTAQLLLGLVQGLVFSRGLA
jgi:hypothetical protein